MTGHHLIAAGGFGATLGVVEDDEAAPLIRVHRSAQRLALETEVALEPPPLTRSIRLGLSAVVESVDGGLSYWALRHPPGKPDKLRTAHLAELATLTLIVQGTMSTYNTVRALPEIDKAGLNVKIVAGISPQLFAAQPVEYRKQVLSEADRIDSTVISNRSRRLAYDWIYNGLSAEDRGRIHRCGHRHARRAHGKNTEPGGGRYPDRSLSVCK